MGRYVVGIDQSTQGTKALLFDGEGKLLCRSDLPHEQIVDGHGWVEHDLDEIYKNTIQVVKNLVEKAGIDKADIAVLSGNLFTIPVTKVRELGVDMTIVDGRIVHNVL